MAVKFTARIPSNVQYGYYEVEADTPAELLEGEAYIQDHLGNGNATDEAQNQAIGALQRGGLVGTMPGLTGRPAPAFAPQGAQEQVAPGWKTAQPASTGNEGVALGSQDGYEFTFHAIGKYGPYFKAWNGTTKDKQFANAPKGMAAHQATLQVALQVFAEKAAKGN